MFHFKKFSIDDSKAAMKIGTDAVLLGAWAPCNSETRILDIGTGSGILALMMAQRNPGVPVDAVEIDEEAAAIAAINAELSPWHNSISIINSSLQLFTEGKTECYSLVICNPPFFTNSLKAPDAARSTARHNDSLPVNELLFITSKLLNKNGRAAFILPASDAGIWLEVAAGCNLHLTHRMPVRSYAHREPHRILLSFCRTRQVTIAEKELCIYSDRNTYSNDYKDLTRDFYLKF